MEELWSRLSKWQNNFDLKMTRETYFKICEQTGKDPDPDKIPPEVHDFPSDVQKAMILFNKLGDRIYPEIGYLGKDYTQLPTYMDVYEVDDKKLFLETLLRLDGPLIQKSAESIKRQREQLKAQQK